MEHIGTRIAALRKKAGMSQEDLAKESRIYNLNATHLKNRK